MDTTIYNGWYWYICSCHDHRRNRHVCRRDHLCFRSLGCGNLPWAFCPAWAPAGASWAGSASWVLVPRERRPLLLCRPRAPPRDKSHPPSTSLVLGSALAALADRWLPPCRSRGYRWGGSMTAAAWIACQRPPTSSQRFRGWRPWGWSRPASCWCRPCPPRTTDVAAHRDRRKRFISTRRSLDSSVSLSNKTPVRLYEPCWTALTVAGPAVYRQSRARPQLWCRRTFLAGIWSAAQGWRACWSASPRWLDSATEGWLLKKI